MDPPLNLPLDLALDRRPDLVSTRPTPRLGRLMLQLGAFLGVVYVVFLAVWVWATRFRPRD